MNIKTDTNRILMSDTLKGMVPSLDDDSNSSTLGIVAVLCNRLINGVNEPFNCMLHSVLFDIEPEIELLCSIDNALDTIQANSLKFQEFIIMYNDRKVEVPGPFIVKAAKIYEVKSNLDQCILALSLQRYNNNT